MKTYYPIWRMSVCCIFMAMIPVWAPFVRATDTVLSCESFFQIKVDDLSISADSIENAWGQIRLYCEKKHGNLPWPPVRFAWGGYSKRIKGPPRTSKASFKATTMAHVLAQTAEQFGFLIRCNSMTGIEFVEVEDPHPPKERRCYLAHEIWSKLFDVTFDGNSEEKMDEILGPQLESRFSLYGLDAKVSDFDMKLKMMVILGTSRNLDYLDFLLKGARVGIIQVQH
jgi:hypothetical protein